MNLPQYDPQYDHAYVQTSVPSTSSKPHSVGQRFNTASVELQHHVAGAHSLQPMSNGDDRRSAQHLAQSILNQSLAYRANVGRRFV